MKKIKLFKISFLIFFGLLLFIFSSANRLETVFAKNGDALAVRVIPNPDFYSPLTWYYKQGFKGTPIALKVDGYEAIRDGRTVYVNVANIDDKGTPNNYSDDSFYTNIYLISYNQEAAPEIISVLDQILAHWKFNINLTEPGNCFNQDKTEKCLTDADCDTSGFCDSLKAKLTRDAKRLGDVVDLRAKVETYKINNGFYPKLSSGTYINGATVSTWPSWNSEFASTLGGNLPLDPINQLGDCGAGNYDKKTCWNDQDKIFADPNPANSIFELPNGSKALIYSVDSRAQNYTVCAYMESGFLVGNQVGACYGGVSFNDPPEINCGEMIGLTGQSFAGYVNANDPEGDKFSLTVQNQTTLNTAGFTISSVAGSQELSIKAASPVAGNYNVNVVATPANGGPSTSETCQIKISSEAFIIYPISNKRQIVNKPVAVSIYANNSNGDYAGLGFNITASDNQPLSCVPKIISDGRAKCDITIISNTTKVITITVMATNNASSAISPQQFTVEFYNNPPVLAPTVCAKTIRVGQNYSCDFNFSDPDGDGIGGCNSDNIPNGLFFYPVPSKPICRLEGSAVATGTYSMLLSAYDQNGAESKQLNSQLLVTDYCGDGKKQEPNSEGKDGRNGDGYEDCDCGPLISGKLYCYESANYGYVPKSSNYGVPKPEESSSAWQYDCKTSCASANAGFCDDGVVQTKYGEECDFGGDVSCCINCKFTTQPTVKSNPLPEDKTLAVGMSTSVGLPLSRGITGGNFNATVYMNDISDKTGPAIVFAVDASYLAKFNINDLKVVVNNFLASLYEASSANNANVYVSSFAFGDCGGDSICNLFKQYPATGYEGLANFKNFTTAQEGYQNYTEAASSLENMIYYGDTTYGSGPAGNSSGGVYGFAKAREMLAACDSKCGTVANPTCVPNPQCQGATEKYLVFLSDGVDVSAADTEAAAAKAAGIKIYTMVFTHRADGATNMCRWSSDYDYSTKTYIYPCASGHYSFGRYGSTFNPIDEANAIFAQITNKILDNIPTAISYSINGINGTLGGSAKGVGFLLSGIACDLSGKRPCNPNNFSLKLIDLRTSSGAVSTAKVKFNNFILDRLPLCEE
ncbi:MAG: hypothetical protein WC415_03935 [Patescibacteria group bacterium]|jgi:hypothetical protein